MSRSALVSSTNVHGLVSPQAGLSTPSVLIMALLGGGSAQASGRTSEVRRSLSHLVRDDTDGTARVGQLQKWTDSLLQRRWRGASDQWSRACTSRANSGGCFCLSL